MSDLALSRRCWRFRCLFGRHYYIWEWYGGVVGQRRCLYCWRVDR